MTGSGSVGHGGGQDAAELDRDAVGADVQLGGRVFRDRLAGATLFIPAEKGVTTDYLKRVADAHQAQMAGGAMKDCPFGVAGSTIEVSSNNSGYLMVAISSKNDGAAKEILRRAELAVK